MRSRTAALDFACGTTTPPCPHGGNNVSGKNQSKLAVACQYTAIPLLLIGIALIQHCRARTLDQSSWIGCGFGMFATLENNVSRFVLPRYSDDSQIPSAWQNRLHRVKVIPIQKHLDQLRGLALPVDREPAPSRLELYKITFDPENNILSASVALESPEP